MTIKQLFGKIFLISVVFQLTLGFYLTQIKTFEKVKVAHAAESYDFKIQVDTSPKDADPNRKDGAKIIISWSKPAGAGNGTGYSWHGFLNEKNCSNFVKDYPYNFENTSQFWDYMEWGCKYSFRLLLLKDDANGTFDTGFGMARIIKEKNYTFTMPKQMPTDKGKKGGLCPLAVKMAKEDFVDGNVKLTFSWPKQKDECAGFDTADITGPGGRNEANVSSPYATENPEAGIFTFITHGKDGKASFDYDPKKVIDGSRMGVDENGNPITASSNNGTGNSGTSADATNGEITEDKCYQGMVKDTWDMIKDPFGTAVQKMECIVLVGLQNATSANVISWIRDIMGISDMSATLSPDGNTSGPQATFVTDIWKILLNFINIFLIFVIITVAFANIFRINIDKYAVKKALPGAVLGVILANFSGIICRGILDIAELCATFVTGHAVGGPTTIVLKAFGAFTVNSLLVTMKTPLGMVIPLAAFLLVAILALALLLAGLLFLFIMALRVGIIFTLYAISPLAFLALGSPITSGLFKRWWDDFLKWAFVPVMMYFLLWMAGLTTEGISGWRNGVNDPGLWDMIKAIMSLALIWTAMFLPFKLKGWLAGAIAGFAANKVVNPAINLAKKGANFGKDAAMAKADKIAADKGWTTPWAFIKGWRDQGKQEWDSAQRLNMAEARAIRQGILTGRKSKDWETEYSHYKDQVAKEQLPSQYSEEEYRAIAARIGKPKNMKDKALLQAIDEAHMAHNNWNDEMIVIGDPEGLRRTAFDGLKAEIDQDGNVNYVTATGEEQAMATETLRNLMRSKGYSRNLDNKNDTRTDRDKMISDWNEFITDVQQSGGVNNPEMFMRVTNRMYDSGDEMDKRIKKSFMANIDQIALNNKRFDMAHIIRVDLNGEIVWNNENNWKNQERAATAERAKLDPQGDARDVSYIVATEQDVRGNMIYGTATGQEKTHFVERNDAWWKANFEQAGRLNDKRADALLTKNSSGISTLMSLFKEAIDSQGMNARAMQNLLLNVKDNMVGNPLDTKNAGLVALVRGGVLKINADNEITGLDAGIFGGLANNGQGTPPSLNGINLV